MDLFLGAVSLKFKAKTHGALRAVSVCSWAHGSLLACFFLNCAWEIDSCHLSGGKWWLVQTSLFLPRQFFMGKRLALSFPPGCCTLESECSLLLDPSLPLPMALTFHGSFREHLNSISYVPFCLSTIYPLSPTSYGLNVFSQNSYTDTLIWWYLQLGPWEVNWSMRVKPSWTD